MESVWLGYRYCTRVCLEALEAQTVATLLQLASFFEVRPSQQPQHEGNSGDFTNNSHTTGDRGATHHQLLLNVEYNLPVHTTQPSTREMFSMLDNVGEQITKFFTGAYSHLCDLCEEAGGGKLYNECSHSLHEL